VVFRITATLALCLVAFSMAALIVDSLRGGPSTNVVALWGIPAIGYAVWWLRDRPIPRALAIWAHSYTVFVALCVVLAFRTHETADAVFLAVQTASLIAVPLTGRCHRRRRATNRHAAPDWQGR
jgi:hypothetical protein